VRNGKREQKRKVRNRKRQKGGCAITPCRTGEDQTKSKITPMYIVVEVKVKKWLRLAVHVEHTISPKKEEKGAKEDLCTPIRDLRRRGTKAVHSIYITSGARHDGREGRMMKLG
jgi:hypothetical protein